MDAADLVTGHIKWVIMDVPCDRSQWIIIYLTSCGREGGIRCHDMFLVAGHNGLY